GASWNFVLWGAWHGLFLVVERARLSRLLDRLGAASHLYALVVVMIGWVLFRCDTLEHAGAFYAALAGQARGDSMRTPVAELLDPLLALTLVVALIGSMPVAKVVSLWRERVVASTRLGVVYLGLDVVWLGAAGIAATAWLASGTYNPFIYFRF
ncbi:MAG TPA: MBOAT family protein, partial [Casimicrobiaceae bacterium]|nr:MBOAT family protein [Casimicrobiaceae bacterium]